MDKNLIDTKAVAKEFDSKVRTMRDYKRLGIIEPVRRIKNKDYYDRREIARAVRTVDNESMRYMREIAELVIKDRNRYRKANK